MSMTLNLVDRLMSTGRNLEQLGLFHQACQVLSRLARFNELPTETAEEAQSRLGRLQLERGQFSKARKHLAIALTYEPNNARYHHLLATAILEDDDCDRNRATPHFERCLELDPENTEYLIDFARHCLERGETEEGLEMLRRAFDLATHDADTVSKIVEEIREAGELEEARDKLRVALFRNGRDPRFRQLWNQHQFHFARAKQQRARGGYSSSVSDEPILLPFTLPGETMEVDGRVIRQDAPQGIKGPTTRRRMPK